MPERYISAFGDFDRDSDYITTRITGDGRDGCRVEPHRYRPVVSRASPRASRAVIVRRLIDQALAFAAALSCCLNARTFFSDSASVTSATDRNEPTSP